MITKVDKHFIYFFIFLEKNTNLFIENDAQEMLQSMPATSNPDLQQQMSSAREIFIKPKTDR